MMKIVIGLNDSSAILALKVAKNKVVEKLTNATFEGYSLSIRIVMNHVIQYLSMMIGNKIYFTNRDNLILATIVNMASEMVDKKIDYDMKNTKIVTS